jgi:hypothetical protein
VELDVVVLVERDLLLFNQSVIVTAEAFSATVKHECAHTTVNAIQEQIVVVMYDVLAIRKHYIHKEIRMINIRAEFLERENSSFYLKIHSENEQVMSLVKNNDIALLMINGQQTNTVTFKNVKIISDFDVEVDVENS